MKWWPWNYGFGTEIVWDGRAMEDGGGDKW